MYLFLFFLTLIYYGTSDVPVNVSVIVDFDVHFYVFPDAAERRASKLVSLVTSCFTGNYVRQWPEVMAGQELQSTPVFDGRAVLYPSDRHLRDYLSWRQADTHVNNQVSRVQ
jgi:tRNA(His) 5'-end guanylyltransferase